MIGTNTYNYPIQSLSLDIQNPQIPGFEVFGTLKAFSGDVWGFKYVLTMCLDV